MKVLIAGEGRNELGGWHRDVVWRETPPEEGVIEALLRRIRPEGWQVGDGWRWRDIRKLRVGGHREAEKHNVHALLLHARERGFTVVAFVRDRDRDRDREQQVEAAIQEAQAWHVVGGIVIERIEDWIRHLLPRDRRHADPETMDTAAMVAVVQAASLHAVPDDLRRWLERARRTLAAN